METKPRAATMVAAFFGENPPLCVVERSWALPRPPIAGARVPRQRGNHTEPSSNRFRSFFVNSRCDRCRKSLWIVSEGALRGRGGAAIVVVCRSNHRRRRRRACRLEEEAPEDLATAEILFIKVALRTLSFVREWKLCRRRAPTTTTTWILHAGALLFWQFCLSGGTISPTEVTTFTTSLLRHLGSYAVAAIFGLAITRLRTIAS